MIISSYKIISTKILLLDRYIGLSFLKSFFFSWLAFALILILGEGFALFKSASEKNTVFVYYYILFSLPHFFTQALPLSFMFGACFSINQFHLNSELLAVYSAGRSLYRAVLFPLLFSFSLSLLQLLGNQFFFNSLKAEGNRYKEALLRNTHVFSKQISIRARNLRGKEGFYYVNFFDKKSKNIYDGFSYLQMDKENKPLYFYEANDASYRASQREWLLTKVRIISFSPELQISSVESKESLSLALPEKPDFFEKVSYFPSELGIDELYKEIQKSTAQGTDALEYTIEFHTRLVFPISCSLLCFIGLIGGTSTKRRTGSSFTQALLLSTFIILVYYVSFTICRNLALSRIINPAITAWLPIGIYIPIMLYLIRK